MRNILAHLIVRLRKATVTFSRFCFFFTGKLMDWNTFATDVDKTEPW